MPLTHSYPSATPTTRAIELAYPLMSKTTDERIAGLREDYDREVAAIRAKEAKKAEMREKHRIWREQDQAKQVETRAKLEAEFGTAGHAKADLLWSMAWDHGHAAGYSEVEDWYSELVQLVDR